MEDLVNNAKRVYDEAANAQEPKKARVDEPSAVLHCRNVPADCTDMELLQLGQPFGKVVNVLMLKGKTQAFIQMESPQVAANMLSCYSATPPLVRKRSIYFSYSQHKEITNASLSLDGTTTGTILLVRIYNQAYPVTLEVLCQVFSKFGMVLKMVTFTKDGIFQCLVQFSDATSAEQARQMLDGQDLYARSCTLKVEPSKLSNLTVKYNNERSWDFTNPNLPSGGDNSAMTPAGMQSGMGVGGMPPSMLPMMGYVPGVGAGGMGGVHAACLLLNNLPTTEEVTPDLLFTLVGIYADVDRVKILYNKPESALIQLSDANQADTAIRNLNGTSLLGNEIGVVLSRHTEVIMPRKDANQEPGTRELTKDFTNSPLHRFNKPGSRNFSNITSPNPILHVSNIPMEVDEADLTTLFSPYGNVTGLRFFQGKAEQQPNPVPNPMKNERRMALVRFDNTESALMALLKIHNYPIAPRVHLRLTFSKADF